MEHTFEAQPQALCTSEVRSFTTTLLEVITGGFAWKDITSGAILPIYAHGGMLPVIVLDNKFIHLFRRLEVLRPWVLISGTMVPHRGAYSH